MNMCTKSLTAIVVVGVVAQANAAEVTPSLLNRVSVGFNSYVAQPVINGCNRVANSELGQKAASHVETVINKAKENPKTALAIAAVLPAAYAAKKAYRYKYPRVKGSGFNISAIGNANTFAGKARTKKAKAVKSIKAIASSCVNGIASIPANTKAALVAGKNKAIAAYQAATLANAKAALVAGKNKLVEHKKKAIAATLLAGIAGYRYGYQRNAANDVETLKALALAAKDLGIQGFAKAQNLAGQSFAKAQAWYNAAPVVAAAVPAVTEVVDPVSELIGQ